MKSLRALLIPLAIFGTQLQGAQASKWDKYRNVGWTAHDQLTRERWEELQKILRQNIGATWSSWHRKNNRLATLREFPKKIEAYKFINFYIDSYSKLDEAERRVLMRIADDAVSGLLGSGALTEEHKKALVQINAQLEQFGTRILQSGDRDTAADVGAMSEAFVRLLADRSGESKKQAEAKAAIPPKNPAADPEQERASLQFYVSVYLKQVDAGVSEELRQRAFQMAATGISNLNVPQEEKNEAISKMVSATPQEPERPGIRAEMERVRAHHAAEEAQFAEIRAAAQRPAPAKRASVSEQPKRAAARPSIAEAKASDADKKTLKMTLEQIFDTASRGNKEALGSRIAISKDTINKLQSISQATRQEILNYIDEIPTMSELRRAAERIRIRSLDVLDPRAWERHHPV